MPPQFTKRMVTPFPRSGNLPIENDIPHPQARNEERAGGSHSQCIIPSKEAPIGASFVFMGHTKRKEAHYNSVNIFFYLCPIEGMGLSPA
jgi:hypothetical protein